MSWMPFKSNLSSILHYRIADLPGMLHGQQLHHCRAQIGIQGATGQTVDVRLDHIAFEHRNSIGHLADFVFATNAEDAELPACLGEAEE